uniref:TFIIS N-terminal domain-containing protein n=1 Tax=Leersia perrieri TaxID=77586 RepID=A0A0D9UZS4_9ORYZ
MESGGDMGRWREMFRGADIYDVIRNAILIAAADSPRELHRRRQGIVELLFAVAPVSTSSLADKGKATAPQAGGSTTRRRSSAGKRKRSDEDAAAAGNAPSKFKQHAVEKLLDEIDEDTDVLNEVLRIKEILINYKEQSEETLFDGLRRLELMRLSLAALKSTEIIGAVVPLGKHRSPVICDLVQKLKTCWKGTASDWVTATSKLDTSPNNTSKPYVVEGDSALPTPPMDMGAFFLFTWSTAEQYVSELGIQAQPLGHKVDIGRTNNSSAERPGLEATKRKLSHAYQEAENELRGCAKLQPLMKLDPTSNVNRYLVVLKRSLA